MGVCIFFFWFFFFFESPFSQRLAPAMEKRNMGVDQLATLAGVTPGTVTRWLRGSYNPRHVNLISVADALGNRMINSSAAIPNRENTSLSGLRIALISGYLGYSRATYAVEMTNEPHRGRPRCIKIMITPCGAKGVWKRPKRRGFKPLRFIVNFQRAVR